MERQRTKEGAPFSAALNNKKSITQEVLAVNVYLYVIRIAAEVIERMRFAQPRMQNQLLENRGAWRW